MRISQTKTKEEAARLVAPATSYATNREDDYGLLRQDFPKRRAPRLAGSEAFDEPMTPGRRAPGWHVKLGGSLPRSIAGRVSAGVAVLGCLAGTAYGLNMARRSLMHDARLAIPSSRAVEITGNHHLTRAQLLSVFGEDVDRNLLTVPLESRRAELQALPWVEHATVMRLLPNRVRVAIVERTPVAFVRQGGEIGLVDAHGVLLDMAGDASGEAAEAPEAMTAYSFPVVSGVSAKDPGSVRAARMKLYLRLTSELDGGAEKISPKLSEVDVSDPEDVKALTTGDNVLVHLGDKDFLKRYKGYEDHLPEWKTHYPKLASVDMRYDREVVLQMAPGAAVPVEEGAAAGDAAGKAGASVAARKMPTVKKTAVAKKVPAQQAAGSAGAATAPRPHLEEAFDVKADGGKRKIKAGPQ